MPLAERLQDETREHHARLEVLPCFRSLSARTLPPESHQVLRAGFTHQLEGVVLEAAEEEGVVRAARETFSQVRNILDALHPPRVHPPAWWLNRDSGGHPITRDLDDLRAALRAIEETLARANALCKTVSPA